MYGMTCWFQGDFIKARGHLEQTLAIYDIERDRDLAFRFGVDVAVPAMAYLALIRWSLGETDQARLLAEKAVTHAIHSKQLPTIAYAYVHAAVFEMMRRDHLRSVSHAETLVGLAREHRMPLYLAFGTFHRGWAMWHAGDRAGGTARMREGMTLIDAQSQKVFVPMLTTVLAETEGEAGQPEAGIAIVDAQLATIEDTGQRWFLAEVNRSRGELLLKCRPPDAAAAATAFKRAIDVARSQSAKLFELRAATSLARLWAVQGKRAEARDLLAPIHAWFTEGFDAADIGEATSLLDALAVP
jgi:predicted ATPase